MKVVEIMGLYLDLYEYDLEEYCETVYTIKSRLDKYIKNNLYKNMSILELLQVFIDNFVSKHCNDDNETLRRKIISHSNRVYKI